MIRRKKRSNDVEVNVGSFADVAFLLIIFFILTTTFVKDTGTMLEIPAGEPGPESSEKVPTILLMEDNSIRLNDKPKSMSELVTWLTEQDYAKKDPDKRTLILEAHENVGYQTYYSVLSAVNRSGAVVALMTDDTSGGSE